MLQVGLAIFKYYEEDIVMYSEPDELRTFLSRINPSSEPILKIAFHEYADLTQERINCMRTQFQVRNLLLTGRAHLYLSFPIGANRQ